VEPFTILQLQLGGEWSPSPDGSFSNNREYTAVGLLVVVIKPV
jgi:hypothetical protein